MTDLVAFLRARLDDLAAVLAEQQRDHEGPCVNYVGQDPANYDEYDSCALHIELAERTTYRDPAFGLADVEAKRRIVELMAHVLRAFDDREAGLWPDVTRRERDHARVILEQFALPLADHPEYDQSWRP